MTHRLNPWLQLPYCREYRWPACAYGCEMLVFLVGGEVILNGLASDAKVKMITWLVDEFDI